MIHDKERVEALRAATKVGIDALNELQAKTTDSGFHGRLSTARYYFGDIESFFLSKLKNQDKTPAAEAFLLDAAEHYLDIPQRELRELQKMFNAYGPGIMIMVMGRDEAQPEVEP